MATNKIRPIYETPKDIKNEKQVAKYISEFLECDMEKQGRLSAVDYYIKFGARLGAVVEIKVRKYYSNEIETYMMSKKKVDNIWRLATAKKVPALLVVKFKDMIMLHELGDFESYVVMEGGRVDRGDPQDREPCYFIPMELFTEI